MFKGISKKSSNVTKISIYNHETHGNNIRTVCHEVLKTSQIKTPFKKHNFGIQISTADQRDGGLSGSTLKEAISWGKNDSHMDEVMIWGEASVYLPLLLSYVQNINRKDKKELNKHINTNLLQDR